MTRDAGIGIQDGPKNHCSSELVGSIPTPGIYSEYKIYGPYIHAQMNRKYMVLEKDGKKNSILYSRYLMEIHLNRRLNSNEEVDHINEDKTDDRLENLQVLSSKENRRKALLHRRPMQGYINTFTKVECKTCGVRFKLLTNEYHRRLRRNKNGIFCSQSCGNRAKRYGR